MKTYKGSFAKIILTLSEMKLKPVLLFFIIVVVQSAYAQITFQKTYGGQSLDEFNSIQPTFDGNYILVGRTANPISGTDDVYLIKTTATGDTLWTKAFGGLQSEIGISVKQTVDSGYIIAGHTNGFGFGNHDAMLLKTDTAGNLQWAKAYGGSNVDIIYSVIQTADGGYVAAGYSKSPPGFWEDVLLIKTNAVGDTVWTRTFGGTSNNDRALSVLQTNDGGFIVIGQTASFGGFQNDLYVVKTDSMGMSVWSKIYVGAGTEIGYDIRATNDGGYILAGRAQGYGPDSTWNDAFLIKTDSIGNAQWSKTFGTTGNDFAYCIHQTLDNGYIVCGYSDSLGIFDDCWLYKTDSLGILQWSKTYGGQGIDLANAVILTSDGGYIIAGYESSYSANSFNAYLIKTDSAGNSGCHETNPITNEYTVVTQVVSVTTVITNKPLDYTNAAMGQAVGTLPVTLCLQLGISQNQPENNAMEVLVFPNPAHASVTVEANVLAGQKAEVVMYDAVGKEVYAFDETMSGYLLLKTINTTSLANGLYTLQVKCGNAVVTKKLAVQH